MGDEVKRVILSPEAVAKALIKLDSYTAARQGVDARILELLEEVLKELQGVNAILFEVRKDTQRTGEASKLVAKAISDVRSFLGGYKRLLKNSFGTALVYLSSLNRQPPVGRKFKDSHTRPTKGETRVPRSTDTEPLTATVAETVDKKKQARQ